VFSEGGGREVKKEILIDPGLEGKKSPCGCRNHFIPTFPDTVNSTEFMIQNRNTAGLAV